MESLLNKKFSIEPKNIVVKELVNSDFLNLEMYCISDIYPNRNKCAFTLESMEEALSSVYNKPILGYFSKKTNDFEEHNSDLAYDLETGDYFYDCDIKDGERAIGLIRESDLVEVVEKDGQNWLHITCAVWCKYNRNQVKNIIKSKRKKVSVEISCLSSHYDESGIEIIDSFVFNGVTILGRVRGGVQQVIEGVPDAHLSLLDFVATDRFKRDLNVLNFAYNATFLAKEDWGTGKSIIVDMNPKSASDDNWGDISKTDLRNDILKAKNYKSLVKNAYLVVEEGWMEAPSDHLKYPVVQIKNGKLVLNKNGVKTASSMLSKEKDKPYYKAALRKLNLIRKRLSMNTLAVKEKEMEERLRMSNQFTQLNSEFKCLLSCGSFALFSKEGKLFVADAKDKKPEEFAKEDLCEVEIAKKYDCDCDMPDDEEMKKCEEMCAEWTKKMADLEELNEEEDGAHRNYPAEIDRVKEELSAKTQELESVKRELSLMKEEAEKKEKEEIHQKMKAMIECEDRLSMKEKEEVVKMVDEDKFSCEEECEKEMAYIIWKREASFSYSIINDNKNNKSNETALQKAKRLVDKK